MLASGQIISGFTVEDLLGEDPLAATYGVATPSGDKAVLRLLLVRLPDFQERFRRSAQLLEGVTHDHLVRLVQMIEVDGLPGVITEKVTGGDLASWIGSDGRAPAEVLPLFQGLVAGVGAAHEVGLLHRNLKPSKVLITHDGHAKVNDFALGKVTAGPDAGQALTQMGTSFGTPQYMPPEQFRGVGGVDQRADLFALGCLLYEMLTGHRAFKAKGLMDVYTQVTEGDFDPLPGGVPASLVGIVADLLAPEADHRPSSARALLRRLAEDPELAGLLGDAPREVQRRPGPTLMPGAVSVAEIQEAIEGPDAGEPVAVEEASAAAPPAPVRSDHEPLHSRLDPPDSLVPGDKPLPFRPEAETMPPTVPVPDVGHTIPDGQVFISHLEDALSEDKMRRQVYVLGAIGLALLVAMGILVIAIVYG